MWGLPGHYNQQCPYLPGEGLGAADAVLHVGQNHIGICLPGPPIWETSSRKRASQSDGHSSEKPDIRGIHMIQARLCRNLYYYAPNNPSARHDRQAGGAIRATTATSPTADRYRAAASLQTFSR